AGRPRGPRQRGGTALNGHSRSSPRHFELIADLRARLADRNRLPRWINAVIDHVAERPMGLLGRLAARRFGMPDRRNPTPVTDFGPEPLRLLIAPVNYSGQGWAWARAVEKFDATIGTRNMSIDV